MSGIAEIENLADFDSMLGQEQENPEVYYFTAPWCAPCKKLGPILEKIAKEHPDFAFLKIDIDRENNSKIAERYNVVSVPTLVLSKPDETDVSVLTGAQTERGVLRWLGLL